MMKEEEHEVVIVGAGIAGLATAVALKKVGIECLVIERASELRPAGAALSLFPNAWRALDVLGVAHKLTPVYPSIESGLVTNITTGAVQEFSYTGTTKRAGMGVRALHRKVLSEALAEELSPATIRFSCKLASIKTETLDDSSTIALLQLDDGTVIRAKILIGCDGVHSVVAQWLGLSAPRDSGRAAVRALSVFPQGHGLKREARFFLEVGKRAGFVPINDTEVYWFSTHITTPREKEMARGGDPATIKREVIDHLARGYPSELLYIVENTDFSTLSWAPLMYRAPWDLILSNKIHKGPITVAGDAMHPMTPELAQGGGAALEDAVVLARNVANAKMKMDNGNYGIEGYVNERKWRVAGLVTGAYLSGWVQQGGSGFAGWAVKWFRDHVFFRFVQPRISDLVRYDCGELPKFV